MSEGWKSRYDRLVREGKIVEAPDLLSIAGQVVEAARLPERISENGLCVYCHAHVEVYGHYANCAWATLQSRIAAWDAAMKGRK